MKEIELSEKQGTGISKILFELKKNGSPEPDEFEMDADRNYLNVIIHILDGFENSSKNRTKRSDKDKMNILVRRSRQEYSIDLSLYESKKFSTQLF